MQLLEPRFIKEGWEYFDEETEQWKLKPDAPDWARNEFKVFYNMINSQAIEDTPDEDIGQVRNYYFDDEGHLVHD